MIAFRSLQVAITTWNSQSDSTIEVILPVAATWVYPLTSHPTTPPPSSTTGLPHTPHTPHITSHSPHPHFLSLSLSLPPSLPLSLSSSLPPSLSLTHPEWRGCLSLPVWRRLCVTVGGGSMCWSVWRRKVRPPNWRAVSGLSRNWTETGTALSKWRYIHVCTYTCTCTWTITCIEHHSAQEKELVKKKEDTH